MNLVTQRRILKERFDLHVVTTVIKNVALLTVHGPKIDVGDGKMDHAWEVRVREMDLNTRLGRVIAYYPWRKGHHGLEPSKHRDLVTAVEHAMSEHERSMRLRA